MALPSFHRNLKNQKTFRASSAWLHELGAADARGAEVLLDYTSDCTVTQEVELTEMTDDSGQVINFDEVVKSVKISMKFKASDEKIRLLYNYAVADTSFKDKYFGVTLQLAKYDDAGTAKVGYYTFYKVKFSQAFTANLGSNDIGFMLEGTALPNKTCANYTATLPTGTCFTPTATGATIGADEFYVTADGAIA